MLKRWDHYLPSEKLRRTAPGLQGGPPQVRGQVWLRLLNVDQVKAGNAGKYQEMKEAALVSSRDIMQIDLDVNRTFRSHTMFWDRYGVRQRALFQEVGYCQGTSEIAAILMFLPEEDAFWALAQLMTDRHAMHGRGADVHRNLHPQVVSPMLPQPDPLPLTLKLWDAYVLDGERVLTAMAYTILKVHRKRLLKLPLEGLREFLQDSLAQPWALEDEAVLRHLLASMTQLRRMRCDLHPPPAGPEEFPTWPLGLERVSLAPGPLLPSPASEPPPRVEEQASPGPATQPEPPGPPPSQAIVQLLPQRWNSLPILPVQQDGAGRRPPDMVGLKTKNGVPFPSAPAWATPEAP
uniref:Rab-GAP TBC domain-containing protein n=1 Tax=Canis lupus familiaris TaxID=9615 RepID=A0A8C0SDA7_CANLF